MAISDLPFENVCTLLDSVASTRGANGKVTKLVSVWKKYIDEDSYPIMRLLLPTIDIDRGAFGLRESVIARIYIDALSLADKGEAAMRLRHYKDPNYFRGKVAGQVGDFSSTVYNTVKLRCPRSDGCTIGQTNEMLDRMTNANTAIDYRRIFIHMLSHYGAREHFWIIRIILKDLKLGISSSSILNSFHSNAMDVFNSTSSLKKVCAFVLDPLTNYEYSTLRPMNPVRPMLSSRFQREKLVSLLTNCTIAVEVKYDGERVHVHKQDDEIRLYSRNCVDLTDRYGYGQLLRNLLVSQVSAQSCILDAELVSYSNTTGIIQPFGSNRGAIKSKDNDLCLVFFDIILYNGRSLLNMPLQARRKLLFSTVQQIPKRLEFVQSFDNIKSISSLLKQLDLANELGQEGLVVKNLQSVYKPGCRDSDCWVKLKADYIEGLADTLDMVILGGYYGDNKNKGKISKFLLGAIDTDAPSSKFVTVCRVGSGFSQEDLGSINESLQAKWQPSGSCISGVSYPTVNPPDVTIDPLHSMVIEISGFQVTRSSFDKYSSGFTIRFPHAVCIRYDKSWTECLSVAELASFYSSSKGRIHRKPAFCNDNAKPVRKYSRIQHGVSKIYQQGDIVNTDTQSELFMGLEFCVLSGYSQSLSTKSSLELSIAEHGGKIVQNPLRGTNYVVVGDMNLKSKNILVSQKYDVVKPEWVSQSIEEACLCPLLPGVVMFITEMTQKSHGISVDIYGDSFCVDATTESLRQCIRSVPSPTEVCLDMGDETRILNNTSFSVFRGLIAYFTTDTNTVERRMWRLYGGIVSEDVDSCGFDFSSTDNEYNLDWIKKCISEERVAI